MRLDPRSEANYSASEGLQSSRPKLVQHLDGGRVWITSSHGSFCSNTEPVIYIPGAESKPQARVDQGCTRHSSCENAREGASRNPFCFLLAISSDRGFFSEIPHGLTGFYVPAETDLDSIDNFSSILWPFFFAWLLTWCPLSQQLKVQTQRERP